MPATAARNADAPVMYPVHVGVTVVGAARPDPTASRRPGAGGRGPGSSVACGSDLGALPALQTAQAADWPGTSLDGQADLSGGRRWASQEEVAQRGHGVGEVDPPIAVVVGEDLVGGMVGRAIAAGEPRRVAQEQEPQEAHAVGEVERAVQGEIE